MSLRSIFSLVPPGAIQGILASMRLGWMAIAAMVGFVVLAPGPSSSMGYKPKQPPRQEQLMVRFEDGVTQARIGEIWAAERIEQTTFLANLGLYVVRLSEGLEASAALERLKKYPEVRHAEIDARVEPLEDK